VYLPRAEEEPSRQTYDETFTVLLAMSVLVVAVVFAVTSLVPAILPDERFAAPFHVLLLSVPLTALRVPGRTMLERRFAWGKVATAEVGGDLALYATGVTLALCGLGVWAPVCGYFAWQLWSLGACMVFARYLPRLRWSWSHARVLSRYGLSMSTSTLLSRSEDLINPMVVGRVLGPEAVGFVSFAMRIGDTVAFPVRASWRLSLVALGRVQSDPSRLRRGIEESMSLQVLVLGPAFAGFCLVAPVLVPAVFGDGWGPAVDLLPFVAVRYVLQAMNGAQASALYVLGEQAAVVRVALVRLIAAAAVAAVAVPLWGLKGFGLALLAPAIGFVGIHRVMKRHVPISYKDAMVWALAFMPTCFVGLVGLPAGLALCLTMPIFLSTATARRRLREYGGYLRRALRPRAAAARS
jgi:PST family polysaccharide transporter